MSAEKNSTIFIHLTSGTGYVYFVGTPNEEALVKNLFQMQEHKNIISPPPENGISLSPENIKNYLIPELAKILPKGTTVELRVY